MSTEITKNNLVFKPYIIGISGGSASGKTSVSREIFNRLGIDDCKLITMDSYYRVITKEERDNLSNFNFDHPSSFDFDLLLEQLRLLLNGNDIEMPIYDFVTSSRKKETETIKPAPLIIFEGIFALYDERIRNILDMMIFVDTDDDIRLARRSKSLWFFLVYRDVRDRGRDVFSVISRYNKFVKPAFEEYIKTQRRFADVIIPKGSENKVAIDLISNHLISQLEKRLNLTKKKDVSFLIHDIFDTKTYDPKILKITTDSSKHEVLKTILEDIVNHKRYSYDKIFAQEFLQVLIDLYVSDNELYSCYILDELSKININLIETSKNTLFFKNTLVNESDLTILKPLISKIKSMKKRIIILSVYLHPKIVKLIQDEGCDFEIFSVFHSNLMDESFMKKILNREGHSEEYSFNKNFLAEENMCHLFKRMMFSVFEEYD